MHFFLISALAGSAVASNFLTTLPRELRVRQTDESFIPDSQTVSACFSNEIECPGEFQGSVYCSQPSRGDTCCPQGYNCPGTNFCLIDGYCCPEGLDPKECARQNGVTLPESSAEPTSPATTEEAPASTVANVPTSTIVSTEETSTSSSTSFATASATPPYVIPNNTTTFPTGTASGSGVGPSSTGTAPFTGAANVNSIANGVVAAFGLGLMGALL